LSFGGERAVARVKIKKLEDKSGRIRIDTISARDVKHFHLEQMDDHEYLLVFEVGGADYHLSFTSRGKVKASIWRDTLEDSEAKDVTTIKKDYV
jgi:hypothetical protein